MDCCKDCDQAAIKGHLICLKYLHENGCPWTKLTSQYAVMYGHLECLKYAHTKGCPWTKRISLYAVMHCQLDCLKYLHKNGLPWHELTCRFAAQLDNFDCLEYAYINGCPDREKYHEKIKDRLLKRNTASLKTISLLRIYISRFLKKYYTPPNGLGYLKGLEQWNQRTWNNGIKGLEQWNQKIKSI